MKNAIVLGALAALVSAPAFAQSAPSWLSATDSGSFDVVGAVQAICVVEVEDKDITLDLFNGEEGANVATIKETCNSGAGYTIAFASANDGDMQHTEFPGELVDYTFNYDTATGADLAKELELTRTGAEFQRTHDVLVDVKGDFERLAGQYIDYVKVKIAAN